MCYKLNLEVVGGENMADYFAILACLTVTCISDLFSANEVFNFYSLKITPGLYLKIFTIKSFWHITKHIFVI